MLSFGSGVPLSLRVSVVVSGGSRGCCGTRVSVAGGADEWCEVRRYGSYKGPNDCPRSSRSVCFLNFALTVPPGDGTTSIGGTNARDDVEVLVLFVVWLSGDRCGGVVGLAIPGSRFASNVEEVVGGMPVSSAAGVIEMPGVVRVGGVERWSHGCATSIGGWMAFVVAG